MRVIQSALTIAAAAALAACTTQGVGYDLMQYANYDSHCFGQSPKHLAGVNWGKARVVNVDIRNGRFPDLGVNLRVGEPTILRIHNRDDGQRSFNADEFMRAVALEHVTAGGQGLTRPCIKGVSIGAGDSAEMRLVPVKEGYYYPDDAFGWYFGPREIFSFGGIGVIVVNR